MESTLKAKLRIPLFKFWKKAGRIDDSAVGYAGVRTDVYSAFSQIYGAGKGSIDSAKHLIALGTLAGRIYGYLILRHVGSQDADVAAKQLLQDHAMVLVMNGCIGHSDSVSHLVTRIQQGESVIFLPGAVASGKQ
ncbi:MAG TPA: hypothetical protein VHA06_23865 [Candidatus Angelobacter sp.]|nr:hypothetical protein [Candidatus Angelobacter sp.]